MILIEDRFYSVYKTKNSDKLLWAFISAISWR